MKAIKTGALVYVLPAPNPAHRAHAGEVRVVGPKCAPQYPKDPDQWLLEGIDFLRWTAAYLKLIDGDDISDEEVRDLYAPSEAGVTA